MVMMVMMVTMIVMMMTVVLIVKKRMIITANRSKLYEIVPTFLQNFHTRKLGEITIFFAVFLFDNGFDFLE